jgi:hypothetical protein
MILRMARPWRHRNGVWYLRERIPQDVLPKAPGLSVRFPAETGGSVVTVGPRTAIIKASLRTKDVRTAKDRHAVALAHLKSYWEAVRKGPQPLTNKQVTALAGHIYQAFANACEDDPVSPQLWRRVAELNEQANRGEYGPVPFMILVGTGSVETPPWKSASEAWPMPPWRITG